MKAMTAMEAMKNKKLVILTTAVMAMTAITAMTAIMIIAFPSRAKAVNMFSDSYKIQWGNVNIGSGTVTDNDNYNVDITLEQIAPGEYSVTGYLLRAGFQYIHSIIPFSFSISDLAVNLGSLTPGTPGTDTNELTVSANGSGGYQIFAQENHFLRSNQGDDTEDTVCDGEDCDETDAGVWSENGTYGFGFNINGNDGNQSNIPADFVDTTYFRQFANSELSEAAQIIASSDSATATFTATVTYKANVSATQEAGNYENAVTYIAVPAY